MKFKLPESFTLLELIFFLLFIVFSVTTLLHHFTPMDFEFLNDYRDWYETKFEWNNGSFMIVLLFLYINSTRRTK